MWGMLLSMQAWTAALLAILVSAGGAVADEVHPQRPRDPPGVRDAQMWLRFDWRECRTMAYPEDLEAGTAKFASTVRFVRAGKRLRGALTIEPATLDGTRLVPTPAQAAFIRCVRKRFEARRFHPGSPDEVKRQLGAWGLVNPAHEMPVLQAGGELGVQAAAAHVRQQLAGGRKACYLNPNTTAKVAVDVAPDGSVTAVTVTGAPPAHAACLRNRLMKRLRFPASARASQVAVMG